MSATLRILLAGVTGAAVTLLGAGPATAGPALPDLVDDVGTVPWGETTTLDLGANDVSLGDEPSEFYLYDYPGMGEASLDPATGVLTYTASFGTTGTDTFSYEVYDVDGESDRATVTMEVATGADTVAADDEYDVFAGAPTNLDVTWNDSSFGTLTSVEVVTGPSHGTAGTEDLGLVYTAAAGYEGDDELTYRVHSDDGSADTATVRLHVSVPPPPEAVDDSDLTVVSGEPTSLAILANDSWSTDNYTLSVVTPPEHGTADVGDGSSVSYTSDAGFYGTDSLVYRLTDAAGQSDTATATVDVRPPGVSEVQAAGAGTGSVVLTWRNPDAVDAIVVRYSDVEAPQDPADGTGVPVTGAPETVTVTGLTEGTTYHFSVFAMVGSATSAPASVSLAPYTCPDLTSALDAGTLVTGASWVACSGPDANDGASTVGSILPRTGSTQALMTSGDIAVAEPPSDDDGEGSDNGTGSRGAQDVSIYRIDLDVPAGRTCLKFDYVFASEEYPEYVGSPYNDGFVAQLDQNVWVVNEDSTITATDNFAKMPDGDFISVNSSVFAEGATVYLPDQSGTGYDGMSVPLTATTPVTAGQHAIYLSIFDAGDGVLDSAAFIDNLRATAEADCQAGSNQSPVAQPDAASTPQATAVTVDVLANDTDPDGDPLSVTSAAPAAAHGTVACTASACTYTPEAGFAGEDSFTYTVSDGRGGSDTATVTVTVQASPNTSPVAVDDAMSTVAGTEVSKDLVANDTDADGDELSISGHGSAAHGTVACTASACTYTPNPGFSGEDSFTYTVSDGRGGSDTATVTVTVQPAPDPQVAAVSITVSPTSVLWPKQVAVSGTVTNDDDTAAADVDVELWARPFGGDFAKVDTVTSADDGSIAATTRPAARTTYQWRVADPAVSSPTRTVSVRPLVTIARSPAKLAVGDTVTIEGRSTPTRVGTPVKLQRRGAKGWVTIKSTTIDKAASSLKPGAPYSFSISSTKSGTFSYRVLVPADAGRLKATSATVKVAFYAVTITTVSRSADEFVAVKNIGKPAVAIGGWVLENKAGDSVALPGRTIYPGKTLKIHTGKGKNDASNLYLRGKAMFKNSHDVVRLYDASGHQVAKYSY